MSSAQPTPSGSQSVSAERPVSSSVRSSPAGSFSSQEIEQVRQALAASGYPNASLEDVTKVLEHVREAKEQVQHTLPEGNGPTTEHSSAAAARVSDSLAPTLPTTHLESSMSASRRSGLSTERRGDRPASIRQVAHRQQWDASTFVEKPRVMGPRFPANAEGPHRLVQPASQNPALYLRPTVRLERHLARYEKSLVDYYLCHGDAGELPEKSTEMEMRLASSAGLDGECRSVVGTDGDYDNTYGRSAPVPHHHGSWSNRGVPEMPQRDVPSLPTRCSANIVFNVTGDKRFRFRPTTTARAGANVPHRAFKNLYNTQGSDRCRGQALSTYSVCYLNPNGSTLSRRADPVKRGEQMRALWRRDTFLSQHGRDKEMWRTRQATMAYEDPRMSL